MIETQVRPTTRTDQATDQDDRGYHGPVGTPSQPTSTRGRRGRIADRLWTLLNAQALLNGVADARDSHALIEDDSRRMAGRRAH